MKFIAVLCFGDKVLTSSELKNPQAYIHVPLCCQRLKGLIGSTGFNKAPIKVKTVDLIFALKGALNHTFDRLYLEYQFDGFEVNEE